MTLFRGAISGLVRQFGRHGNQQLVPRSDQVDVAQFVERGDVAHAGAEVPGDVTQGFTAFHPVPTPGQSFVGRHPAQGLLRFFPGAQGNPDRISLHVRGSGPA